MQTANQPKQIVHDIPHLEKRLKTLVLTLETVRSKEEFEELIKTIHHPGWTTPVEYKMVLGIVESMIAHAKALSDLRVVLTEASREIANQETVVKTAR